MEGVPEKGGENATNTLRIDPKTGEYIVTRADGKEETHVVGEAFVSKDDKDKNG